MKSKLAKLGFVLDGIFFTFTLAFMIVGITGTFRESRLLILISRGLLTAGIGSMFISRFISYVHRFQ